MTPELLERAQELEELHAAFEAAATGNGRAVMIEAEPGVGKTSLLDAAARDAELSGLGCLRARATELESEFAYGCVRQLLEPPIAAAGGGERAELLGGAAALCEPLFDLLDPVPREAFDDPSFPILHGLYWFVTNLATKQPVALLVDDAHWADPASLRFLAYLAPRLDGLAAALVVAVRPSVPAERRELLAALSSRPETTLVRPSPLSATASAELCEERLTGEVAPDFADACHEVTAGNPLFLESLLREVAEREIPAGAESVEKVRGLAPPGVADAILLRLSGQPPEAEKLAQAVAVLGDGAALDEAADLAGLDVEVAGRAADLLSELAILAPAPRPSFAHPIAREAVYASIPPRARAQAHDRAANALADRDADPRRIAAQTIHAAPAGDQERVALLREVSRAAHASGAPRVAARYLTRALEEPPSPEARPAMLSELGWVERSLGEPAAVDHLRQGFEAEKDPRQRAFAARRLGTALWSAGSPAEGVAVLELGAETVGEHDPDLAREIEAERISLAWFSEETWRRGAERLRAILRRGASGTDPDDATGAVLSANAARLCLVDGEPAARTIELATQALEGRRPAGEIPPGSPASGWAIFSAAAAGAFALAERSLERALARARAAGWPPEVALALLLQGDVELRRGNLPRAIAAIREHRDLSAAFGFPFASPAASGFLASALVERGELEQAAVELSAAAKAMGGAPHPHPALLCAAARGRLELARGNPGAGLTAMLDAGRRCGALGTNNPAVLPWRSQAALARLALGEVEEARELAENELELAEAFGAPHAIGVALRAVGLIEGAERGIELLGDAVESLDSSGAELEHGRALVDLGAALRRAGRRTEARDRLLAGFELADRCGAVALSERCRVELAAIGARPKSAPRSGVDDLTPSERRVAELAAKGMSNPEIAQSLFVTRKTVETHLGHAYAKLGISSRAALPELIAGSEPPA